jgi:cytosine/adenosine deaminase-related metal-dependent hydrolase
MATRIARAAEVTGIGLTLLPSFYAHSSFGGAAPHAGQRRFICSVDQFARLMDATKTTIHELPGANIGIAPHSLRAVTPDELAAIAPLAEGGPVHIHAAEQIKEVEECIAWSGRRPDPCDPHHRDGDISTCQEWRCRRPLPDYRSEPRRRHFPDP